jgi:hypothetical protein
MRRGRRGFDAVLLGDGTVLAVGDDTGCLPGPAQPGSETAELYDPVVDEWLDVESLNKPRTNPATVALPDGTAMVIGGVNSTADPFSSTKIFSPATRAWTNGPLLDVAREYPVATTLADGRVLVVSQVPQVSLAKPFSGELYDPRTGVWSRSAAPEGLIEELTPMSDGRVFGFGYADDGGQSFEIYDPHRDSWTVVDAPRDPYGVVMNQLADGTFLALRYTENSRPLVERFDPAAGRWTPAAPMPTPRALASVVVLSDGRVMFAGGIDEDRGDEPPALRTTDLYDPAADRWTAGPDLLEGRAGGSALLLGDGSVLLMGGSNTFNDDGLVPSCSVPMTSVERLYPRS